MKLAEENIDTVMMSHLPETEEYARILYDEQEAGRVIETNFAKFEELNGQAWRSITMLMARCIARGMRIEKEKDV